VYDFCAEQAAQFLTPEVVETEASRSLVTFQPLGVVLAVMPWNFPCWQFFRFVAPAVMASKAGAMVKNRLCWNWVAVVPTLFWPTVISRCRCVLVWPAG
jgi:hypothetical protein